MGQWIDPIFTQYIDNHPFQIDPHLPTNVMVQCGGLGSTKIFNQLLQIIPQFPQVHFTIALGALNEHFLGAFEVFANVQVKKWFFHEDLAATYAQADIGIVRAAANTLSECALFGLRMIMIPLGIASFNHQYYNALAYQNKDSNHILLPEMDLVDLIKILSRLQEYKKSQYSDAENSKNQALQIISGFLLGEPSHSVR